MMTRTLTLLKQRARALKREAYALLLACRHPRMPWHARIVAAAVVAYAFSPLDLIPDFIPVIGYLDDLILVPLGIALAIKLTPAEVMVACRGEADALMARGKPRSWVGAAAIVVLWLLGAGLVAAWAWRHFRTG